MYSKGLLNSKNSFSAKKSLYLCILIASLLCTQWIGLWHSVSHAEFQIQKSASVAIALDDSTNQHGTVACQLLDSLALGSFIQNTVQTVQLLNHFKHVLTQLIKEGQFSSIKLSYNSRAPPQTSFN